MEGLTKNFVARVARTVLITARLEIPEI
jgi:hypothetical protein